MNRAQRRQMARKGVSVPPPRPPKPTGEFGVEVDCTDEGVVFTLLQGNVVTSVMWAHQDALEVAKMLTAAGSKDKEKAVEVVRQSGIVVPPAGFQL